MGYAQLEARAINKIIKNIGTTAQFTEEGYGHVSSKTITVNAIFDAQYVEVNGIEAYRPMIFVETSTVMGISHNAKVTVNGIEYDIKETHNDQHGMTAFILQEV